ncbi:MAG TPA: hypothetical protein VIH17_13155 [Candidatus Acidoferrales bacterium]
MTSQSTIGGRVQGFLAANRLGAGIGLAATVPLAVVAILRWYQEKSMEMLALSLAVLLFLPLPLAVIGAGVQAVGRSLFGLDEPGKEKGEGQ